ncbi:hypothetical protein HUB98_16465 [Paenibacillus barcinonensis]|uniref:Hemolysin II n=1 Tax=Paenibacillus barcinonensis TaxID=198119 RepID=A0A2V4VQN3_PAEBA|nr:hypothetical protein [Paenibacillus barcinonensis]PYE48844.1 hypothetical protein DFQ00_107137 [Paenibacillus barcinonensis]QKS57733.1 hypothetical protein HUB98_16465 [Paenibacillus barcinonensis]
MKLRKSLLLVLIICLSFSNVALAADGFPSQGIDSSSSAGQSPGNIEHEDEDTLNEYLRENGYPESIINLLIVEQKKELVNDGAVYVGSKTAKDNITDLDDKAGSISLQALQDTNFSHTLVVSRIRTATKGIAQFTVNYNWNWKYTPSFSRVDKYGLAWNNNYSVVNNSAKHWYKLIYYTDKKNTSGGVTQSGYETIQPGTGIGWNVNLVSRGLQQEHQGAASMTLQVGHDNSGNKITSSMVGNYFHKRLAVTDPEFTFSKEPSVSIGIGSSYDEARPTSYTWTWTQSDFLK